MKLLLILKTTIVVCEINKLLCNECIFLMLGRRYHDTSLANNGPVVGSSKRKKERKKERKKSTYQTIFRVGSLVKGHAPQGQRRHTSCGVSRDVF